MVEAWLEILVCGMKVASTRLGQVPGGGVGERGNAGF